MNFQIILFLFCAGLFTLNAQQPGSLDVSFNPGTGANNVVNCIRIQQNGKILIGGDFTSYQGITRNRIARLNADGSLDPTFNPGSGVNGEVKCIVIQPDGKILIGGNFTVCNGNPRNRIARLNSNGSLDASFNPSSGSNNEVLDMALNSTSGKITVVGSFTEFNGIATGRIVRLNSNGSIDPSFNSGIGSNNAITSIILQTNGKLIIGGNFDTYNGISRSRIARLNVNGGLDFTFNPGTAANTLSIVNAIIHQPDGKIIIGGDFGTFNGVTLNRVARLNTDGSLDNTFNPGVGANLDVYTMALQPDGKILIGGNFTTYNGNVLNRMARLNANGSLDTTFNTGLGFTTGANFVFVSEIAILNDGQALVAGSFTRYNGISRKRMAKLHAYRNIYTDSAIVTGPSSAAVHATVVSGGGAPITARGFCFNTSGNPNLSDSTTLNGMGLGSFGQVLNNLAPGTTYYVKAYGTNSIGTSYGNELSFITQYSAPSLITDSVTDMAFFTAKVYGNVLSNGGSAISSRGFCYNTTGSPSLSDSIKTANGSLGNYSRQLNALASNTTYYVKAYATNNVGTAYGNELSFTTAGLGLNSPNIPKLRVFPNPATDVVYVECPIGSHIKLLDLQGRLLQSFITESIQAGLNLAAYAKGSYVLQIEHQSFVSRQKVVKH